MSTTATFTRGPYLTAAFLCEKVLEEKDGVKSAIRIVDRVTHTVACPEPPKEMPPLQYPLCLYIGLKSGEVRGPRPLRITLVKPSGESDTPIEFTLVFEGEEDRGVDVVGNIQIKFEMPGIYWFHVELDGKPLTQIPLRIIYVPQRVMRTAGLGGEPPPV